MWLLDLIPGGGPVALLGGVVAFLVAVIGAYVRGRSSGKESARAKEADAYEKHLKDLSRAHDARNRVSDGVPEHDKYRRD